MGKTARTLYECLDEVEKEVKERLGKVAQAHGLSEMAGMEWLPRSREAVQVLREGLMQVQQRDCAAAVWKRLLSVLGDRSRLEKETQVLHEFFQKAVRKCVARQALERAQHFGEFSRQALAQMLKDLCEELKLTFDVEKGEVWTVVMGSEGEFLCFALEVGLTEKVDSVQLAFSFGEDEWSSEEANAEVKLNLNSLVSEEGLEVLRLRLRRVLDVEARAANLEPESAAMQRLLQLRSDSRSLLENLLNAGAFLSVHDRLDGTSAIYSELVPDLAAKSLDSESYSITVVNATEETFVAVVEPAVVVPVAVAARLLGLPTEDGRAGPDDQCSFRVLVLQGIDSGVVCELEGTIPANTSPFLPSNPVHLMSYPCAELDERGFSVSRIEFKDAEQLANVVSLLKRQVVYNRLLKSCFSHGATKLQDHGAASSIETTFEVAGDVANGLITLIGKTEENMFTIRITVDDQATVQVQVQHPSASCSDAYLTEILSRSLSAPVMLHYMQAQGSS